MTHVVKLNINEDGGEINDPEWHLIVTWDGSPRTFCSGEVFGFGEGNARGDTKDGQITCLKCIQQIKEIKAVRLK